MESKYNVIAICTSPRPGGPADYPMVVNREPITQVEAEATMAGLALRGICSRMDVA